jgi:enamine deaminase RidA (YjgF/YER057c/UK114 family)
VSGTTASSRGDEPPEQIADEATIAFAIALDALAELGFDRTEVVRTRMYVTDINDAEIVGRVHGNVFEGVNPASTMVGVSALIDPRLTVEVELEAAKESMTK